MQPLHTAQENPFRLDDLDKVLSLFALLRKKKAQQEGTPSYHSIFPFRCIIYADKM